MLDMHQPSVFKPCGLATVMPNMPSSVMSHTRFFTRSISKTQPKCHHFSHEEELLAELPHRPSGPTDGGGGERDRTDDLLLAKQALSQLSYTPGFHKGTSVIKWWAREDLNLRPHAYQARALTS